MRSQGESKAVFMSGVPGSGKTLIGRCLDKHPAYAYFDSQTKFIGDPVFYQFPDWLAACPKSQRAPLIGVFKKLCQTRFYFFYRDSLVKRGLLKKWDGIDRWWRGKFEGKMPLWWSSPGGRLFEAFWLTRTMQSRSWLLKSPVDPKSRWRKRSERRTKGMQPAASGLYIRFSDADIFRSAAILDGLAEVDSADEACRVFGRWMHVLFGGYAIQNGKSQWIDEKPAYIAYGGFLKRCFNTLKIIHVVRDPRHVASFFTLQEAKKRAVYSYVPHRVSLEDFWKRHLDRNMRTIEENLLQEARLDQDMCLRVKYERFVESPKRVLSEVMEFIDGNGAHEIEPQPMNLKLCQLCESHASKDLLDYARSKYSPLIERLGYTP